MDERDIYRSAKLLVDQYGADAAGQAGARAEAMIARGDMEGAAAWRRIIRAIGEIEATQGRTKH